jgi:hypothetical protein
LHVSAVVNRSPLSAADSAHKYEIACTTASLELPLWSIVGKRQHCQP